jgi:hypothetical protein
MCFCSAEDEVDDDEDEDGDVFVPDEHAYAPEPDAGGGGAGMEFLRSQLLQLNPDAAALLSQVESGALDVQSLVMMGLQAQHQQAHAHAQAAAAAAAAQTQAQHEAAAAWQGFMAAADFRGGGGSGGGGEEGYEGGEGGRVVHGVEEGDWGEGEGVAPRAPAPRSHRPRKALTISAVDAKEFAPTPGEFVAKEAAERNKPELAPVLLRAAGGGGGGGDGGAGGGGGTASGEGVKVKVGGFAARALGGLFRKSAAAPAAGGTPDLLKPAVEAPPAASAAAAAVAAAADKVTEVCARPLQCSARCFWFYRKATHRATHPPSSYVRNFRHPPHTPPQAKGKVEKYQKLLKKATSKDKVRLWRAAPIGAARSLTPSLHAHAGATGEQAGRVAAEARCTSKDRSRGGRRGRRATVSAARRKKSRRRAGVTL